MLHEMLGHSGVIESSNRQLADDRALPCATTLPNLLAIDIDMFALHDSLLDMVGGFLQEGNRSYAVQAEHFIPELFEGFDKISS